MIIIDSSDDEFILDYLMGTFGNRESSLPYQFNKCEIMKLEEQSPKKLEEIQSKVTALMIDKIYSIKVVKPTNELAKQCY